MKLAPVANQIATRQTAAKPQVAADSTEIKDTVVKSEGGSENGQLAKMAVTGIGTAIAFVPVTYGGVVGGAVLGGLAGMGLSPMSFALAKGGFLSGLGAAWSTLGGMGKAGMILGTMTGIAGSFAIGKAAGNLVGKVLGAPSETSHKHPNLKNPVTFAAGATLLTVGLVGGAIGGVALVGGTAAAGSLVKGVFEHGFSKAAFDGIGSTALKFGVGGAAVAGIGGAMGGAKLTKGLANWVVDPATNAITGLIHKDNKPAA